MEERNIESGSFTHAVIFRELGLLDIVDVKRQTSGLHEHHTFFEEHFKVLEVQLNLSIGLLNVVNNLRLDVEKVGHPNVRVNFFNGESREESRHDCTEVTN